MKAISATQTLSLLVDRNQMPPLGTCHVQYHLVRVACSNRYTFVLSSEVLFVQDLFKSTLTDDVC